MKWLCFGAIGLLLACQPAPEPPAQQVSGSLQTIQDAYLARLQSLKNAQQILQLQFRLDSLSSVTRELEATATELRVKVAVLERLADREGG